jgi:hypothetical protein
MKYTPANPPGTPVTDSLLVAYTGERRYFVLKNQCINFEKDRARLIDALKEAAFALEEEGRLNIPKRIRALLSEIGAS